MMRWRRPHLEWARSDGFVVSYHWTCIGSLLLILSLYRTDLVTGIAAWLALMFLVTAHELGHAAGARAHGGQVIAIRVGALHGVCVSAAPYTRRAALCLALGGVQIQAVIAAVVFVALLATSQAKLELEAPLAAALFVLGPINVFLIVCNLLPWPGSDGALALAAWRGAAASEAPVAIVDRALERLRRGSGG